MGKNEIVNLFLEKGILLEREALEILEQNQNRINEIVERIEKMEKRPTTLNKNLLNSLITKDEIRIETKNKSGDKKLVVSDILSRISLRYVELRDILLKNQSLENLLSISKINPATKKFSIIGLVKEKDDANKSILIEDETGETYIFATGKNHQKFEEIVEDEVIGFVCSNKTDRIEIENIFFPDIPLSRKIGSGNSEEKLIFVSGLDLTLSEFKEKIKIKIAGAKFRIISLEPKTTSTDSDSVIEDKNESSTHFSWIHYKDKFKILFFNPDILLKYREKWENLSGEKILINLLKKRHLNPIFNIEEDNFREEDLILKQPPDIFITNFFNESGYQNYKGVTIISLSDFSTFKTAFVVDLKTHETFKLDFT